MTGSGNSSPVRKLTLPGGLQVGIQHLDGILSEVAAFEIEDTAVIGKELLSRVKACNYVPDSAEPEYEAALVRAYLKKIGGDESAGAFEARKPHAG